MNIFLVRHAQSQSNEDYKILHTKTNVSVHLTPQGHQQALETGNYFAEHFKDALTYVKVWNSPYDRTRLTAQAIKDTFESTGVQYVQEESIYIAERQFGLVDDTADYPTNHPDAYNHYQLHSKEKKEFFARPPLGESPFDMCQRLDFFLRIILANDTNTNHIIVSHGAAIRGLLMMQQKWNYEKYGEMPNPYNASIHLIEHEVYKGEIFKPTIWTK
jgi:broad specificity phosphatase PhoE